MTDADQRALIGRYVGSFIGHAPHMAALGIVYRDHGDDWAELALPFAPHLVAYSGADGGVVASGAIYALMDSTAGMAAMITRRGWEPVATLDMRLDYLRAPRPRATIISHVTCTRMTRHIGFVRGHAHDGDPGDPLAAMAGTFMFTAPDARPL